MDSHRTFQYARVVIFNEHNKARQHAHCISIGRRLMGWCRDGSNGYIGAAEVSVCDACIVLAGWLAGWSCLASPGLPTPGLPVHLLPATLLHCTYNRLKYI